MPLRPHLPTAMLAATLCLLVTVAARPPQSDDDTGLPELPHGIAALDWMTGTWVTSLGPEDQLEETWAAPEGDALVGMFHWTRGGHTWLYELIVIEQRNPADGGGLVLHLRHFNRGLKSWDSERDGPLTLPLKSLGTDRVVFADDSRPQPPHRMIYLNDGDDMVVRIESNTGEANEFRFTRKR